MLELADSAILPYNLERFPHAMQEALDDFDNKNATLLLKNGGVTLQYVKEAVKEFENSAQSFMQNLNKMKDILNPLKMRIVNDQMMQLERVFNMPNGIPGEYHFFVQEISLSSLI